MLQEGRPAADLRLISIAAATLLLLLLLLWRRLVSGGGSIGTTKKLPLPPGTMGWPYIGETFQLFSKNPITFFALKQKKYGSVFKTHILGCPCVMVSSPEAARLVLVSRAELFKPTFPASKERMLGRSAIFFQQGGYHARLRRLVLRAFLPDSIRRLVPSVEAVAARTLRSCSARASVNAFDEMKSYAFDVALLSIFGDEEEMDEMVDEVKSCYYTLEKGYNSMPINLPGTLFYKAMKARARLAEIVAGILLKRRQQRRECSSLGGLLGSFMEEEDLDDSQIIDNTIGVIFAARDTTASVLTWILKYLAENPAVLQAVTEEQEEIMRSKMQEEGKEDEYECDANKNSGKRRVSLSWGDTKRMPMTTRVIQETMRVASILSFTYREAVEDVEFQGYLIPKGWKVLPMFRNIHHSPENFVEPDKFDPSRFEESPKPNTYMPFGNGIHSCPGNELAKLEILVLLHHLTTTYRWSCLEGSESGIQFGPFALPLHGLPIRVVPMATPTLEM